MKRSALLLALVAIAAALGALYADEPPAAAGSKLVGTWKIVSARYNGQEVPLLRSSTTLKHVTPTQFMWASFDSETGVVSRTAGGTYTLKGEKYEETPRYGLGRDFEVIRGKAQSFTCKVEGNRWHHVGTLSTGVQIDEVWERVETR